MKIALLCIVALLQSESLATIVATEPADSCACSQLIADEIWKLSASLADALESIQQEGIACTTCAGESACSSSLGTSSYQPAKSCKEILQCNPSAQSSYYWLNSTVTDSREVYCAMSTLCDMAGGWTRLAYLNVNESSASCPTTLRQINTPAKLCGGAGVTCSGVTYPTEGIRYGKVCGQVKGYQYYSTDAFGSGVTNIDSYYVDGISITYGSPRQHLWTYASGLSDDENNGVWNCPCTVYPGRDPPDFVWEHYYCESGITGRWQDNNRVALEDPLWDGAGCGPGNNCCNQTGMPWFYRTLQQDAVDDIEVRFCTNEGTSNEAVYAKLVEIYVQ